MPVQIPFPGIRNAAFFGHSTDDASHLGGHLIIFPQSEFRGRFSKVEGTFSVIGVLCQLPSKLQKLNALTMARYHRRTNVDRQVGRCGCS